VSKVKLKFVFNLSDLYKRQNCGGRPILKDLMWVRAFADILPAFADVSNLPPHLRCLQLDNGTGGALSAALGVVGRLTIISIYRLRACATSL